MPTLYTLLKFLTPLEKIFVLFVGKDIFLKNKRKVNKPQEAHCQCQTGPEDMQTQSIQQQCQSSSLHFLHQIFSDHPTRLNWEPF